MGRYYHGDIEGKFWFAVQSSTDAEFFGVLPYEDEPIENDEGELEEACYCTFSFNREENLKTVIDKVKACEKELGDVLPLMDDFFNKDVVSYNDESLLHYLTNKGYMLGCNNLHLVDVKIYLQWYARLQLGNQIQNCLIENEFCVFECEY